MKGIIFGLVAFVGLGVLVAVKRPSSHGSIWSYTFQVYEALPGEWAYTVMLNGLFVSSSEQNDIVYSTKALAEAAAKQAIADLHSGGAE